MKYWLIAAARLLLKAVMFAIFVSGLYLVADELFEHFPHVASAVYAVLITCAFVYFIGFILHDFLSYEHDQVLIELRRRKGK